MSVTLKFGQLPVVGNTDYTVKNSCQFADFIRDKTLHACEELVSSDVVSIFTKVPVDLTVKVAVERLREDASLGQRTSLPVEDIIHLLSFCLKTTQFTYNGTYYQQFLVQRWVRPSLLSLLTW